MPNVTRNLCILLFSALSASVVYLLVQNTLQFTTQRIEFLGHFPVDATITVRNIQANGYVQDLGQFSVTGNGEGGTLQRVGTNYINKHVHRLRIEIAQKADSIVTISRIKLIFPYLEDYYFTQDNVNKYFSSAQSLSSNARRFQGHSILIDSNSAIARPLHFKALLLASLFFIGTWCLLRHIRWSELAAFKDMGLGNKISSTAEFDSINGIRGLAALLVLFSHTAPGFESVQMGLSLLFLISGFLLAKPFVLDNSKIFSFANIERYITKRLKRILPMYYLYVFMIFGASLQFETLMRHLVFLQGDGHLWPMTQIFAFYMLLPLVLLITSCAHRLHRIVPLILLSVGCYFAFTELVSWKPFYNGRFSKEFFLYAFLLGVLTSYVHYDLLKNIKIRQQYKLEIIGLISLVVTVTTILWAAPFKPMPQIWFWVSQFWVKCLLSAAIILLALNSLGSVFHKLLANHLLRSVGVVGFSFYLLHGLGMDIFTEIQKLAFAEHQLAGQRTWVFVLGSFCCTYLMAIFSYSYIERPFFGIREKGR